MKQATLLMGLERRDNDHDTPLRLFVMTEVGRTGHSDEKIEVRIDEREAAELGAMLVSVAGDTPWKGKSDLLAAAYHALTCPLMSKAFLILGVETDRMHACERCSKALAALRDADTQRFFHEHAEIGKVHAALRG